MLYDNVVKKATLSALSDRVLSVVDISLALISEGYIPNKNKTIKFNWGLILIHAFENIEILSVEQQRKLENLYNKIMSLGVRK